MPAFKIVAYEKAIVGNMATHMVLGFFKDGKLVSEFNGLSSLKGTPVTTGYPWELDDTIRVYHGPKNFIGQPDIVKSTVLFNGTSSTKFSNMLNAASVAAELINSGNMDYKLLSQNSNSAFKTLVDSMGLKFTTDDLSGRVTPGLNNSLLDSSTINSLKSVANGSTLHPGLESAFGAINDIGTKLNEWAYKYDFSISMHDVARIAQTPMLARTLMTELAEKSSGPKALTEFAKLQESIDKLIEVNNKHGNILKNFSPSMSDLAAAAKNIQSALDSASFFISPLVIDIDGDGVESIAAISSDFFGSEYSSSEAHGWASGDDAFLALDLDKNGLINSPSELFGNHQLDGFTHLSSYDLNKDKVIDKHDAVFEELVVWQDKNENATTELGELKSFVDIFDQESSISLDSSIHNDRNSGNIHALHSTVRTSDGNTRSVEDIYFKTLGTSNQHQEIEIKSPSKVVFGNTLSNIFQNSDIDQLFFGGFGFDTFIFSQNSGNDIIADFELGVDKLLVSESLKDFLEISHNKDGTMIKILDRTVFLDDVFAELNGDNIFI